MQPVSFPQFSHTADSVEVYLRHSVLMATSVSAGNLILLIPSTDTISLWRTTIHLRRGNSTSVRILKTEGVLLLPEWSDRYLPRTPRFSTL